MSASIKLMNDINFIFSKFSLLSSPVSLLKLFRQFEKLMKKPKINYVKSKKSEILFLKIDEAVYQLEEKKFIKFYALPEEANLVIISKVAYINCLKIIGAPIDTDLNQLLRKLRKEKDLKKFQEIIEAISDSFSTNLSLRDLMKIVKKQMM